VEENINLGTRRLIEFNGSSDGLQLTADKLKDARHYSNTLFNIMRGGVFDNNYIIEKWDFKKYLKHANKNVYGAQQVVLDALADSFSIFELKHIDNSSHDMDFKRLSLENKTL